MLHSIMPTTRIRSRLDGKNDKDHVSCDQSCESLDKDTIVIVGRSAARSLALRHHIEPWSSRLTRRWRLTRFWHDALCIHSELVGVSSFPCLTVDGRTRL